MGGGSSFVFSSLRAQRSRHSKLAVAAERARSAILRAICEPLEGRRLLAAAVINGTVTLDESAGLQTSGVAVTGEDNNDSDVALSALQSQASTFYNRLFGAGGFALSTTFATQ